jgi:hypothetical protein
MAVGSGSARYGRATNPVIAEILRQGRRQPRKLVKAALEVGKVESGFRNLPGGDADSAGWRQERASLYPNPTNLRASVRRFYREAAAHNAAGKPAWLVAADTQRPRADLRRRYLGARGTAEAIMAGRRFVGAPGAAGGPGAVGGGGTLVPGVSGAQNQPQGSEGILALLDALKGQRAPASGGSLQAPAATAAPAMPQGYQPPQGGGGPAPKVDTNALLQSIQTVGGDVQLAPGNAGGVMPGASSGGASLTAPAGVRGRGGRVVLDPRANYPGQPLHHDVLAFARRVSALSGHPLRIGTGTRHSRLTINGTVSDHARGEAADVPASGRRLLDLGRAALVAAGMDPRKARTAQGGGYNIGGWQIIFATNAPGWGDHTDHLHIGRRR